MTLRRCHLAVLATLTTALAVEAGAACAPQHLPCGGPPTTGTLGGECMSSDGRAFDLRSFDVRAGDVIVATVSADFTAYLGLIAPPGRIVNQATGEHAVVALEADAAGSYDLIVSSAAPGVAGAYSLSVACFASAGAEVMLDRFAVEVWWRDRHGGTHPSTGHALSTDSSWWAHGNPGTAEVMVKVLDGCSINGHAWVFAAGLTDQHTAIRVRDTATGRSWVYASPQGIAFRTAQDTAAIACDN